MPTATIKPVTPLFIKEADLEIDLFTGTNGALKGAPVDFAAAASSVTITPKYSQQSWQGMKKTAKFTDQGDAEWSLTMDIAQDLATGSLATFLLSNTGVKAALRFRPTAGAGEAIDVNVTLAAPQLGGKINAYATSSVTLGVDGQPVIVQAAQVATEPLGN